MEIVPTGVVFTSHPDLRIPDVTHVLARLPDGRFLSTTEATGVLAEWDSLGRFVRRFGAQGDGPEEFRLVRAILTDPRHPVIVVHPPGVTILDEALGIVARHLAPALAASPAQALAYPDGRFVYAGFHPEAPTDLVHVIDARGDHVRSFRRASEEEMEWTGTTMTTARFRNSDSFWVGPTQQRSGEWILEQWTPEGEHLQTIRRRAEWLESPRLRGAPPRFFPRYSVTPYADDVLMVWTANWDHRRSTPDDPVTRLHWDFIDTREGRLLASVERDVTPGTGPHRLGSFFPNDKAGTVREVHENGLSDIRVVEVHLSCQDERSLE